MAVFFVLPPRAVVGEVIARTLRSHLPGLPVDGSTCLDWLQQSVSSDAYLVFREDLPEGEPLYDCLRENFGAESGDEVREIILSARSETPRIRAHVFEEVATAMQALESL